jgi:hypothetical protein
MIFKALSRRKKLQLLWSHCVKTEECAWLLMLLVRQAWEYVYALFGESVRFAKSWG